jgi:hypothetical protein
MASFIGRDYHRIFANHSVNTPSRHKLMACLFLITLITLGSKALAGSYSYRLGTNEGVDTQLCLSRASLISNRLEADGHKIESVSTSGEAFSMWSIDGSTTAVIGCMGGKSRNYLIFVYDTRSDKNDQAKTIRELIEKYWDYYETINKNN